MLGYLEQDYQSSVLKSPDGRRLRWKPDLEYYAFVVDQGLGLAIGRRNRYHAASSSTETNLSVTVEHELLRNVILSGNAGYIHDDYNGISRTDDTYQVGAGAKYLLNRNLRLSADITYSSRSSTSTAATNAAFDRLIGDRRGSGRILSGFKVFERMVKCPLMRALDACDKLVSRPMYNLFATSMIRCLVAALLLLSIAILPRPSQAADPAAYKLGIGDKVRVTIFGEKDLSGDFDVNDQGEVTLPLIGSVRIAGRTVGDAETVITTAYGKNYLVNPHVNLQVMNYRPFFILGEVKNPGSYSVHQRYDGRERGRAGRRLHAARQHPRDRSQAWLKSDRRRSGGDRRRGRVAGRYHSCSGALLLRRRRSLRGAHVPAALAIDFLPNA